MNAADQATGCRATPGLNKWNTPLYDNDGERISDEQARIILDEGGIVEDPNAGAGNYDVFAQRMNLGKVEVIDWTSSAGDWCFKIIDDDRILFQTNRYPYHGFQYSIGEES